MEANCNHVNNSNTGKNSEKLDAIDENINNNDNNNDNSDEEIEDGNEELKHTKSLSLRFSEKNIVSKIDYESILAPVPKKQKKIIDAKIRVEMQAVQKAA